MKYFFVFYFCVLSVGAQTSVATAKKGDGIFSMLRKNGINPIKYYGEFLELNKDKLQTSSNLVIDETYVLPNAPDSFKKTGVFVDVNSEVESPIFTEHLSKLKLKDTALKQVVYYIIVSKKSTLEKHKTDNYFGRNLAEKLLQKGGKVYLLNEFIIDDLESNRINTLSAYISVINKYYLKNIGSHQRVLFIEDLSQGNKYVDISINGFDNSKEGRDFTNTLRGSLKSNSIQQKTKYILKEKSNLYLTNNLIPSVTSILVEERKRFRDFNSIDLLLKGIEKDYVSIQPEEVD